MRQIDLVIIHCSDSDNINHDDISIIDEWHKARGFDKVGYHYFIKRNGEIQVGREESEIGAHCNGHNKNSIGICLSGKLNFTKEQFESMRSLIKSIAQKHKLDIIDILPHNAFDKNKTCPNFNVSEQIKGV